MSESTNKVYEQMILNESGNMVFGYTGSYNHGSIDTLPEWKAKDKEATNFINSLADKKFITTGNKAKANFYLEGGYGLTAEALTSERARKIASDNSVEAGFQAQLPFQHSEFKTAGDMFDSVTAEKMALDRTSHTQAMTDSKENNLIQTSMDNEQATNSKTFVQAAYDDIIKKRISSKPIKQDYTAIQSSMDEEQLTNTSNQPLTFPTLSSMKVSSDDVESFVNSKDNTTQVLPYDETQKIGLVTIPNDEGIESGIASDIAVKSFDTQPEEVVTNVGLEYEPPLVTPTNNEEISAQAKRLQTLREIETNVVTGPPNAASVDYLKVEDENSVNYLYDENKSFESALVNDADATVDNTYFPPDNPRTPITSKDALTESERILSGPPELEPIRFNEDKVLGFNFQDASQGFHNEVFIPMFDAEGNKYSSEANAIRAYKSNLAEARLIERNEIASKQTADKNLIRRADEEASKNSRLTGEEFKESINDEQLTNAKNKEAADAESKQSAAADALSDEQGFGISKAAIAREKALKERLQTQNNKLTRDNKRMGEPETSSYSLAKVLKEKEIETNVAKSQSIESADRIGRKIDGDTFLTVADTKDPFAFSTLSYPRDLTNEPKIGHYLLFYVNVQNKTGYEYEGVTPTDGDFSVGDVVERTVKLFGPETGPRAEFADEDSEYKTSYHYDLGADKGDIDYQKRQVLSGGTGNILRWNQAILSKGRKALTGMSSVHKTTTRITDSVALYLPANIENNTSASYQDFETGLAGFLALGGKGVLDKILNSDYEGAASKAISIGGRALTEALKKVAVGAVGVATGGQGIQQSFDKAFGNMLNPYLEVAFQSMGVRSFSYTFKFTPKNEDESKDVKAIIELFRFHMLPELKGAQHRYMTLPSTFDIHYMYQSDRDNAKENTFYNRIATCVLTKCNVDYAPEDVRSFDSGAPVVTSMTLEFMETEMLTKEKVQDGF